MDNKISQFMKNEHRKIDGLLEEFEKSKNNNSNELKNTFNAFKGYLDKHFFIEEKVIFHIYNSSNDANFDIISLLKDHKDILWLISNIEDSFKNNKETPILELKKLLKAHIGLEDAIFYPRLDNELNDEEKSMIFDRVEEIIGDER